MMTPTPEQEKVIETWGQGMAVLAGAGSGKTTTLVAKCIKLISTQSRPDVRFAAVSFTERSASDLRAKLSVAFAQLGIPGALNQHWVMTIHGLCGSIIKEYPRESGFDGEESILSEAEVRLLWERAIEALWLEELSEDVAQSLERLLDRESREGVSNLLERVRGLFSFGVLDYLRSSTDHDTQALEKVAHYILERYERLKRRQGVLDFNDLERGADRALEHPKIRAIYHSRFDLILIDEFQDTNPLQAKIIRKLCRSDFSNLCVVGDPKQSIYRFRDADVSVFEEFCSQLPIQLSLTWNFRSVPGILDYTNRVCEKAFEASEMKYEALVPKREPNPQIDSVIRLAVNNPAQLGEWLKDQVEQGIPLHDMALLVRKIRGNEKWLKALSASGIPIAVGSGGLFWEEPRVRELVCFLKWWDNPANSLSGGVFLRAPWMGISDLDLDRWIQEDPTWQKPFFASAHPVSHALKPYHDKVGGKVTRPGELLLALLINQEIEDELGAPLLGLWHRAEEFTSQGLDFHSIVLELSISIDENHREREVPAPRNLGCLLVLTLHGAKGLEFPHVILIDLGEKPRVPDMPLLFWDRNQGAFLCARTPAGDRDQKHPLEKIWRESEKKKNLEESKRLFYVALTRAKERLILVCPEIEFPADPKTCFNQDYWRGWIDVGGLGVPALRLTTAGKKSFPEMAGPSMALPFRDNFFSQPSSASVVPPRTVGLMGNVIERPRWIRPRHSVTEWTLASRCERAYEWKFIRPRVVIPRPPRTPAADIDADIATDSEASDNMSQRELGSRVHACLERGDYSGLKLLEKEVGSDRFMADPVIQWSLENEWMAPPAPEHGRWVWTELDFEVPILGQVLVGSMDRLIKKSEGNFSKYSIIDFKVARKPGAGLLETYQTQLELYAYAVKQLDTVQEPSQIEAVLVHISASQVQTHKVSIGKLCIEDLATTAMNIVSGKSGTPQVGAHCQFCEFQNQCPEGGTD